MISCSAVEEQKHTTATGCICFPPAQRFDSLCSSRCKSLCSNAERKHCRLFFNQVFIGIFSFSHFQWSIDFSLSHVDRFGFIDYCALSFPVHDVCILVDTTCRKELLIVAPSLLHQLMAQSLNKFKTMFSDSSCIYSTFHFEL